MCLITTGCGIKTSRECKRRERNTQENGRFRGGEARQGGAGTTFGPSVDRSQCLFFFRAFYLLIECLLRFVVAV